MGSSLFSVDENHCSGRVEAAGEDGGRTGESRETDSLVTPSGNCEAKCVWKVEAPPVECCEILRDFVPDSASAGQFRVTL